MFAKRGYIYIDWMMGFGPYAKLSFSTLQACLGGFAAVDHDMATS